MHPVEAYLKDMRRIRSTGGHVPELSFYGPLAALINAVGEELSPAVHCINQVADTQVGPICRMGHRATPVGPTCRVGHGRCLRLHLHHSAGSGSWPDRGF